MFGFSLPKLIVLAAIILAVWYGFKIFNRRQTLGERGETRQGKDKSDRNASVDMEPCPKCGDFVARGTATSCGRADCPYPAP